MSPFRENYRFLRQCVNCATVAGEREEKLAAGERGLVERLDVQAVKKLGIEVCRPVGGEEAGKEGNGKRTRGGVREDAKAC